MSKSSNDLIRIYDKQRDGNGLTENGWFVNFKNQEHIRYWTNGQELIIYSYNTTNTIKYFMDKQNGTFGESMISGISLNDEQVIKFDEPIILERDISNEVALYIIPDLNIISFNSSFDIVTIYNKEVGRIDVIF